MGTTVNLSKQTVNLSKSQVINLSKSSEGLREVMIGLGWSDAKSKVTTRTVTETVQPGFLAKLFGAQPKVVTREERVYNNSSMDYDLDAWVGFMHNGKIVSFDDVCYYGKKDMYANNGRFIHHCGDDLTGGGDVNADNEQIFIELDKLPDKYNGAVIGVTIYQGKQRNQRLGDIENTFVRVVDTKDKFEICRYADAIADEYSGCITFIVGKIYKDKGEWHFKAEGFGTKDGSISEAAANYKG